MLQGILLLVTSAWFVSGCDPGEGLLKRCEEALAALLTKDDRKAMESDGDWEGAREACKKLAKANSKLASKGSELVAQIDAREACENNGVPQGGAFTRDTPEKCEQAAQGFREGFGLQCVKCGCSDEMMKVLSGRVY